MSENTPAAIDAESVKRLLARMELHEDVRASAYDYATASAFKDARVTLTAQSEALERARVALERLTKPHSKSPEFPNNGHLWCIDCDACNAKKIAQEALDTLPPKSQGSDT